MTDIVEPLPNNELSASLVHRYVHGAAGHVEAVASNDTAEPATGYDGLYVKDGIGGPVTGADTITGFITLADMDCASEIVSRTSFVPAC